MGSTPRSWIRPFKDRDLVMIAGHTGGHVWSSTLGLDNSPHLAERGGGQLARSLS